MSTAQAHANRSSKVCTRCSIKAGVQVTCQGKLTHVYEYDNSTKRDPRNKADSFAAKKLKVSLELWQVWDSMGQDGHQLMDKARAGGLAPACQDE